MKVPTQTIRSPILPQIEQSKGLVVNSLIVETPYDSYDGYDAF